MSKLKLTTWLLMLTLTTSALNMPTLVSRAWATDTATTIKCTDVINACDKALQADKKAIELRDLRIKQDEDQLKNVTDERNSAEHALNAWYRNPFLWGVVGFGLGVYVMKK